jgi:hypothetical protein
LEQITTLPRAIARNCAPADGTPHPELGLAKKKREAMKVPSSFLFMTLLSVYGNEDSVFRPYRKGGRGRNSLIYTGPKGKPSGESRFPLSLITDGVLKYKVIFLKR